LLPGNGILSWIWWSIDNSSLNQFPLLFSWIIALAYKTFSSSTMSCTMTPSIKTPFVTLIQKSFLRKVNKASMNENHSGIPLSRNAQVNRLYHLVIVLNQVHNYPYNVCFMEVDPFQSIKDVDPHSSWLWFVLVYDSSPCPPIQSIVWKPASSMELSSFPWSRLKMWYWKDVNRLDRMSFGNLGNDLISGFRA
jgi:hypothetical protein